MAFFITNDMDFNKLTSEEVDEILKRKADALSESPITIDLIIQPKNRIERFKMLFRIIPKVRSYRVTGATLRTMLKISRLLLDIKYKPKPEAGEGVLEWAYQGVVDNLELSVKIIAIAIHNQNSEPDADLADLILDGLESSDHQQIALNIINKLDIFTFMDTITLIRPMNILKKVSLEPEEIIAPEVEEKIITGDQLDLLSNIFGSVSPI